MARNISLYILEYIATLYSEKFCQCSGDKNPEKEKYAYPASCLNFPEDKFSIADLSAMIMGENTKPVDRGSKCIELWKLKQNRQIPNSYSKALGFIKERVSVRNFDSGYRVDFRTIIELEKYNNSVRSFINFFSEGIVNHILKQLDSPCCRVKRFIREKIYQNIIANLREMKSSRHEKINCSEAIQCYAYEYFLMPDITDGNYSEFYSEFFAVEAEEDSYGRAENFLVSNKIETVSLKAISNLAEKHKKELAKIIYADMENDKALRKFYVRMKDTRKIMPSSVAYTI